TRDAVEDSEGQVGLDTAPGELGQVTGTAPARHAGRVVAAGLVFAVEVGDAQAEHADALAVGVEPAQRLAKRLAGAVDAVRPDGLVGVGNDSVLLVEAGDVIGAGKDGHRHTVDARG